MRMETSFTNLYLGHGLWVYLHPHSIHLAHLLHINFKSPKFFSFNFSSRDKNCFTLFNSTSLIYLIKHLDKLNNKLNYHFIKNFKNT